MPNLISKLLGRNKGVDKIAIMQYERDGYSVGSEEQFHWAIAVVTDLDTLDAHCYQAIDRNYNDGRKVWEFSSLDVGLIRTTKCLGGVIIGSIKRSRHDRLQAIMEANPPSPKSEYWNCRDWVMEMIPSLKEAGYVDVDITDQASILPALKQASAITWKRFTEEKNFFPELVDFAST